MPTKQLLPLLYRLLVKLQPATYNEIGIRRRITVKKRALRPAVRLCQLSQRILEALEHASPRLSGDHQILIALLARSLGKRRFRLLRCRRIERHPLNTEHAMLGEDSIDLGIECGDQAHSQRRE
ncbi:hypothetical protein GB937_009827 [Aspergillus fischeri]|nr:hypothetical protein GB937_009827 [Aspergillus fischeri]